MHICHSVRSLHVCRLAVWNMCIYVSFEGVGAVHTTIVGIIVIFVIIIVVVIIIITIIIIGATLWVLLAVLGCS